MAKKPTKTTTTKKAASKKAAAGQEEEEIAEDAYDASENSSIVAEDGDVEEAERIVEDMEPTQSEDGEYAGEDVSGEEGAMGDNEAPNEDDEVARTIFIKGLDYDAKEEGLRAEMEKIGPVVRVHVPLTHDRRRNKGFAYVEFRRVEDAEKGLRLNGTELMGREVLVDQARPRSNHMIYTVFVRNLSFDTKKEELLEYFSSLGKVYNLSLPTDPDYPERNRGYAFVEYTDEETARRVADARHKLNDRHLYCRMGNKNEERNRRRSTDRLYGRRDSGRGYGDDRYGRPDYHGGRDYNDRRDDRYGGNRRVFDN